MSSLKRKRFHVPVAAALTALLIFVGAGGAGFGQTSSDEHLNKQFLVRFAKDFFGIFASPFHWKSQDVNRYALVNGAVLFSITLDEKTMDWVQSHKTKFSDDVSKVVVNFGNGLYLLGFAGVLYASGELWHSTGLRRTALLSIESFATAATLVAASKFLIGRARPYTGQYPFSVHLFSTRAAYNAFPSGHTAAAFAVATTIAEQTRGVALDILAYSLATLVGFSRVYDNQHWFSSIVGGALLGHFVAERINNFHRRQGAPSAFNFGLQLGPEREALTVSYSF